ncbi:hypothetical protein OG413_20420 [Streptomyces sp. NBC_01433]|uniref:hypothetical protein n=1 Tax=Streptomyces sp. NBC_01433 TaxID=2903864 RepID=UPI0022530D59|nr:hypothetical protein [Streptomyces sp. NBC_01433]MCX4677639.1 hypothetical protein [Streptomyces sp. NBC_01433]
MTRVPFADVGPTPPGARPPARCWESFAARVPPEKPKRPSTGRTPRQLILALFEAFASSVMRRTDRHRRRAPVMHRLVSADEQRFTELCQQFTGTTSSRS